MNFYKFNIILCIFIHCHSEKYRRISIKDSRFISIFSFVYTLENIEELTDINRNANEGFSLFSGTYVKENTIFLI